jgi:uncharacterized protein (DUF433 family)
MGVTADPDLNRVTVTPRQRSEQPCIRGLRVTVWDVLDLLASGMTDTEILADYPYLQQVYGPESSSSMACLSGSVRCHYASWWHLFVSPVGPKPTC